MSTNNFTYSDLYNIYSVVQNSLSVYPQELVISTMREYFSRDSGINNISNKNYKFVTDSFGFPQVVDHTNLPQDAGLNDNSTTRLYIGRVFKTDNVYYPSILVRHGGSSYVPISFNREAGSLEYNYQVYEDGYGNIKKFITPKSFIFAGAWEGSINLEVQARDPRSRDELVDLISILFADIAFDDLVKNGLIVKGVSVGAQSEKQDRNDYIFTATITLQIRSEFRREIPIGNIIEIITFGIEFGVVNDPNYPAAANLTINIEQTLVDLINNL